MKTNAFITSLLFFICLILYSSTLLANSTLVGSWYFEYSSQEQYSVATFYEDGRYLFYCSKGYDAEDTGVEYGTYNHKNNTISVDTTKDNNGYRGLSDNRIPKFDEIHISSDTLKFEGYGKYLNGKRLTSPTNKLIGSWDLSPNNPNIYNVVFFKTEREYILYRSKDLEGVELGSYTYYTNDGTEPRELHIRKQIDENGANGFVEQIYKPIDIKDDTLTLTSPDGNKTIAHKITSSSTNDNNEGGGGGCIMGSHSTAGMILLLLPTLSAVMIIRKIRV